MLPLSPSPRFGGRDGPSTAHIDKSMTKCFGHSVLISPTLYHGDPGAINPPSGRDGRRVQDQGCRRQNRGAAGLCRRAKHELGRLLPHKLAESPSTEHMECSPHSGQLCSRHPRQDAVKCEPRQHPAIELTVARPRRLQKFPWRHSIFSSRSTVGKAKTISIRPSPKSIFF